MGNRRRWAAAAVLAVVAALLAACVPPKGPGGAPQPVDCVHWRYGAADEPAPGVLPAELDRSSYKVTATRDTRAELFRSPHEHCGQKGPALDLAYGVTKGRDDIVIAVLDSGIEWRDASSMADLATKAMINLGEARPPCSARDGDCNHDGRFDVTDFGAVPDRNGNGTVDPEDLILDPAFNNGVDDDRNGYVDDISGWDFLTGDNDPLDSVGYGHGTGEAKDSTAAENGAGDVGTCPRCRFLPVRVGESFVADGGRFAAGVLFALDSGADVVQEALGAVSNPPQAQQAVDAAYARGVVVVASMADEAAKHPNIPSSLEHTMAVNSITERESLLGGPVTGYLALNGCTNFGGRTFLSIPSGSCSSEATGRAAGMVGLVESVARDHGVDLSADEVMQVLRATADDVDYASPNGVDRRNDFGTPTGSLLDTVRYPTAKGWDATTGYGRVNAYEAVKAVRAGHVPPTVDLTTPSWFDVLPANGRTTVTGRVDAPHATTYDYRVEWTTGLQPPAFPGADAWHVVAARTGVRGPRQGPLATIDLASVAAALPDRGAGAPVDPATGRPDEERFTVRVRVVVTAHGGPADGLSGEAQKQVFVHDDPDLVGGAPRVLAGAGAASPVFADLDGRPGDELVVATDDGAVHALRADGRELPRFPLHTPSASYWPERSPTARAARIAAPGAAIGNGAPVVADLDGDGTKEIVVTDGDGNVWAWGANGLPRPGFAPRVDAGRTVSPAHVEPAFSVDHDASNDTIPGKDSHNRTMRGFIAAPSAADLDGDGRMEIVAAALDRHVYAWHDDGRPVAGFPVLVVDPAKVAAVDPTTEYVTFTPESGVGDGGEIITTPTLADLTGDGRPEIVVGGQEQYAETPNIGTGTDVLSLLGSVGTAGNGRLYAISPDGTNAANPAPSAAHPDEQAYLPGWPVKLGMLEIESLPTIGGGVSAQAAVGDVNPAPGPEVVAASSVGPVVVLDANGHSVLGTDGGHDVPLAWSAGLTGAGASAFGAKRNSSDIVATSVAFGGPAIGAIGGGAALDVAAPTAGLTRLVDISGSDLQLPNDDHLMAWDASTGNALPGFPRTTPDLAFFVTPAIADLDGDGANEVVAGNGVFTVTAADAEGDAPAGWPKLTGGWVVGTPGLGDWDGDGRAEIAVTRRDGRVLVWRTPAPAAGLHGWLRSGGDATNSGRATP